ncbi:cytochrome oxidase assembly protein [Candidatus Nitrosotenuis sp. DW1]|uniref:COX15/CtaA family protein n=2 Tax=Candidatus Nitrosotenuis sp. DW1 TaxID=2259672 RepID=UPI0015C91CAC|nr:COX15/CtaA family protein [Candidatus Nitrosotenuis sp. DW1]QLH09658.1 cytochrome oxidase assembly protein [Candidatus Nitrosotenuis sp. DW1]
MFLKYIALASLVVLYSLMFIGGYVSSAGLGLSCPDWPLCPNGIMPDEEYLIEWTHRFVAATTGALIVATAIGVWLNKQSDRKIKITGTLAAIFVVTQVTLGALVIDLKLHAVLVAVHLGIGILLFAMTLLTVLFAFRMSKAVIPART